MNFKKVLFSVGIFAASLVPTVTMADGETVTLNHPANVFADSYDETNTNIYMPGEYYVYTTYNDLINITKEPGIPGAWIKKTDLLENNLAKTFIAKRSTRVYVIEEGMFIPSYTLLEEGDRVVVSSLVENDGYVLSDASKGEYIRKCDFEEVSNTEDYFLNEDSEIKDLTGNVIGYEYQGFLISGVEQGSSLLFDYEGQIASINLNKLTKDSPEDDLNNSTIDGVSVDTSDIVSLAISQLGKKYISGDSGPNSFDCSGLTRYLYLTTKGISLPRSAVDQGNAGVAVSVQEMQPGDLVFFGRKVITHVGIYVGNGKYVHASTPKKGVIYGYTNTKYFKQNLNRVRRILN